MNARPLFLASALGLAAGIIAGILASPGSAPTADSSASPDTISATAATDRAAGSPGAFDRTDERIVRLFTALHQPVRLRQRFELVEAVRALTAAEIPALMKHAESLPKDLASDLVPALAGRWFELDPRAAEAWAQTSRSQFYLSQEWARADPEGAFRVASESGKWWASILMSEALDTMYGGDSAAMLQRARTLPAGELRDYATDQAFYGWARRDPAAAYAAFAAMPSDRERDEPRRGLLRTWAESDPAGALAKVGEILPTLKAGMLGNDLVRDIAETAARKDPRLALDWLAGIPGEFGSAPAITAARQWAEKEPLAALEWCLANGVDIARADARDFQSWQPAALGAAMEHAPTDTFAWLGALPPGAERDRLLECAFMESMWHTPREQLFGDGEALAWRFYDALSADAQIAKAALFGEKRAEHGDLTDLSGWAQNFAPGLARANAIAAAAKTSYQRDASRADSLLATTRPGADRDAALRGLAEAASSAAPADAARRALGIDDSSLRRDALDGVIVPWLRKDREASRSWLQNAAAVPVAWKQEWLEPRAASGVVGVGE